VSEPEEAAALAGRTPHEAVHFLSERAMQAWVESLAPMPGSRQARDDRRSRLRERSASLVRTALAIDPELDSWAIRRLAKLLEL
jgi:hypothetical protein